jgi:hypothetical protein
MTRQRKAIAWIAVVVALGVLSVAAAAFVSRWRARRPVEIQGVVLRADTDPRKQVPVPGAEISATAGEFVASAKSDSAGYFRLTIPSAWKPPQNLTLRFRHDNYERLEMTQSTASPVYVARLRPSGALEPAVLRRPAVAIKEVRVRYTVKSTNAVNLGSEAKAFEAANTGGLPCNAHPPCSPDGRWKATLNSQVFDAGEGNEFSNARLSCIAGPCPFTRMESGDLSNPSQKISVSVLNWSDTATFLLESEVIHTMASNIVRQLYPVIFGPAMNFTLPASAEGPSIEAEVGGNDIVFPLGPALHLSWAVCTATPAADQSKQFRCDLKPGFAFK